MQLRKPDVMKQRSRLPAEGLSVSSCQQRNAAEQAAIRRMWLSKLPAGECSQASCQQRDVARQAASKGMRAASRGIEPQKELLAEECS